MKLNWLTKFCLFTSILLLAGVFLTQAAGFVSYEDDNKMIIWDPVKMKGKGFKMSALGINDLEDVDDGIIKIESKDLYVRSFMGFECANYPTSTVCTTTIGDVGGDTFLKINTLKGETLYLNANAGIDLNLGGDGVEINSKLIMPGGEASAKNLFVVSPAYFATSKARNENSSVFVDTLHVRNIGGLDTLTLPGLKFESAAFFSMHRLIYWDLR